MNYDKKFISDSIRKLGVKYGTHEALKDVVICIAYSFANATYFKEEREKEYLRIINKYSKEEQQLFPQILTALVNEYTKSTEPIDILGDIYENLNLIKKDSSQFFTPLEICDLIARVTTTKDDTENTIKEKGYIVISDPTCGSGRILYAAYNELLDKKVPNNKILLQGDDLDLTCCCMTYIQLSLMGANAVIHHQNTLTMDRYDTFYTVSFFMNKELQEKMRDNNKDVEEGGKFELFV